METVTKTPKKGSNKDKVLKHLQSGKTLTSYEAFLLYRITRLSATVFELKKDGYRIGSTLVEKEYEDGSKKQFAKYYIGGKGNLV